MTRAKLVAAFSDLISGYALLVHAPEKYPEYADRAIVAIETEDLEELDHVSALLSCMDFKVI